MSCPSHCLFDLVFAFSSHSHCPAQPPKPKRSLCHTFPGDVPGVQLSYSKPQVWDDIPVIKAGLRLPCTLLYALQLQSFKSPDIWVMGSCFFQPFSSNFTLSLSFSWAGSRPVPVHWVSSSETPHMVQSEQTLRRKLEARKWFLSSHFSHV